MPGACCLLGVCCPPAQQLAMLSERIAGAMGESTADARGGRGDARKAAEWVLANFDLVPKGLGAAIVAAYEPVFAEK